MQEIPLNILDLAQNSITAGACVIKITIYEDSALDAREFTLDTREVRKILEGVSLDEYEGIVFLKQYLSDGEKELINAI